MNCAVATYYTPSYQELADITLPTMERYCAMLGYAFHPLCTTEHSGWIKPQIVFDLINAHRYDAVLWLDSDALVTSPHQRIEDLALFGDFVCTADVFGLSTGTFVVRGSNDGMKLLYALLTVGESLVRGHQWAEQEAVMRFARFPPYDKIVRVVPQRLMNSYWNAAYDRPEAWDDSQWQPGDFILHLPGLSLPERLVIARNITEFMK